MSKKQLKRVNKSKKDIVSNLQLVQSTERRRSLIKDIIFPNLVEINESIAYSKVFLQALSGLVNGVFDEKRKVTTIDQLNPRLTEKLNEVFNVKDKEQKKEYDRYMKLLELLKDVSVEDLSYATELPRYIDGHIIKGREKESIATIPISEILGK
jgi:hypothetical protein